MKRIRTNRKKMKPQRESQNPRRQGGSIRKVEKRLKQDRFMTEDWQERIKTTRQRLARYGQEQVLRFADQLSASQQRELLADIDSLDLDMLDEMIKQNVLQ